MAVRFDADGEDYTRSLALGTQTALTVACWFKVSVDRNDYSTIFSIDNGTSDNWLLQSGADGTTIATVFDASTQEGMGSVTVGTWYYVCLATSGTTGTLYYKTASATSLTAQAVTSVTASVNAATLRIGESPWGAEWLNGCVAAFRVWNAQLTAAEADLESRQYVPRRTTNLVGFYPLVKPETTDYSGNGRTLSGGTGTTTEDGPPIPWAGTTPRIVLPAAATGVTLDGISPAAASATGALAVERPLTGSAGAASSATGQLSVARPLTGDATAANSSTGNLSATRAITGTADAASSATGALAVARPLTGTAPAAASASGDLTTQGQVDLTGSAAAASSATGILTVTRALAGSSEAASDLGGALAVTRPLTATASAASSASGDLSTGSGTFVCQDFTTTVSVDAYSATVSVDAYSASVSVDTYSATATVDAYGGTATNCGR